MNFQDIIGKIKNFVNPTPTPAMQQPSQNTNQPITDEEQRQLRIRYAKQGWTRPDMTPDEIAVMPKKTQGSVLGASTVDPRYSQPIPGGTDLAMNFIKSQTPQGQAMEDYYPVLKDPDFMNKVKGADNVRQGVSNLLLTQAFLESTLGKNSNNLFGTKPRGQVSQFNSPSESLDYQLGPNVLGGGANPNMNILNEEDKSPITFDRILQLYKSYDPPGAYIPQLKKSLLP